MDYSDLIDAVLNEDHKTVNRRCAEALPILRNYLISKLGASYEDAEDAVQKMFVYLIPKIKRNEIKNPKGLLAYMLMATKHSYLNLRRSMHNDHVEQLTEPLVAPANQVWMLIDKEYENILLKCLARLKDRYRALMVFLFDYPDSSPEDIAEYFDISLNNVWTRKHRAIQQLSECVKKYE